MKNSILISIISILIASFPSVAQTDTINFAKPILMDRSVLSGVGLNKIDLKDEPEKDFYQKRLYKGKDISVFVVSTETWNNEISNFAFDEYVYLINGQSIVKPKKGNAKIFHTGEHLFVPKGFVGEWEIRAGNHLHYELSVITTNRADSIQKTNYKGFDKSMLSGGQITFENGKYEEVLHKGVELKISLKAEVPSKETMKTIANENLLHILSGQLTVMDVDNKEHTFYTGDFVVFPKGQYKAWKSQGHGMIKYLQIEKSKKGK